MGLSQTPAILFQQDRTQSGEIAVALHRSAFQGNGSERFSAFGPVAVTQLRFYPRLDDVGDEGLQAASGGIKQVRLFQEV